MLPLVKQVSLPWTTTLTYVFLPELHQLTSPPTASAFLDSLFESASHVENALSEAEVFAQYVAKSWVAITKNSM
jgi:ubiquinone biosynthesis protein COQ9